MTLRRTRRTSTRPASATAETSVRTGLGEAAIAAALADNLHYQQAVPPRTRPGTTGTWRSPWPFATACSIAISR